MKNQGIEISIEHDKSICTVGKFSIQSIEKLPGDSCKNSAQEKKMFEYRLQRKDN